MTLSSCFKPFWIVLAATALSAGSAHADTPAPPTDGQTTIVTLRKEADRLYAAKDYAALLPVMQQLTDAGDAHAMHNLAAMYRDGMGVDTDDKRSWALYLAAAEKGYAPSQAVAGHRYLYGSGTRQDYSEARRWCELAASQREAEGLVCLSTIYGTGAGVPEDEARGIDLLRKAVELDSTEAMTRLGKAYLWGEGAPRNKTRGIELLTRAANMGEADAMHALGDTYRSGEYARQDEAAARRWYEKAANEGHTGAQINLALMLVQGMGGGADPDRAFSMMKAAAETGEISAQMNLATMYEEGNGTPVDAFAAHQWLNEALRHPDIDDMQRALIEFRLACLCHGLSKQQMAKAKATSPLPARATVAARQ